MLSNTIRYFRGCYEQDNSRSAIWNIFGSAVEHRIPIENREELLIGGLPWVPLPPDKAREVKNAAHLYQKEKDLVYCSLFIIGFFQQGDQKPQTLCAPLFRHPARIVEHESDLFLEIDPEGRQVNHRVLDMLQDSDEQERLSDRIAQETSEPKLSFGQVTAVGELLMDVVPNLDVKALYNYPELVSETQLKRLTTGASKKPEGPLKVVPASMLALVKKSVEVRGVLNELAEIADHETGSPPLKVLFSGADIASSSQKIGRVPAVLSRAQQQVLTSGAQNTLTLVIGPPGTGKSFTIASLAMEHISRGQSVLIASKMNHAVDVVGNIIEQKLGIPGCVVRGGRRQYLKPLKDFLQGLLSGMYATDDIDKSTIRSLQQDLKRTERSIQNLERRIARHSDLKIAWGKVMADTEEAFIKSMRKRFVRWREQRIGPLWTLLDEMERLLDHSVDGTVRLIQMLNARFTDEAVSGHRKVFQAFLKGIRARTGSRQETMFKDVDFDVLLKALPVWLVNLADISKILPLQREVFDLAIIDEATQCDIASCIPILYRARRAVIVGDPNQLNHISFLSRKAQQALMEQFEIPPEKAEAYDYRGKSILTYVDEAIDRQDAVVFLNEHYRSLPPIIAFSNRTFYGNRLHIMTRTPETSESSPLSVHYCRGKRQKTGENEEEAQRLIEDVVHHVTQEQDVTRDFCHSIGILSPFRSQADHIFERLTDEIAMPVFEKHNILIGTAHTFQGEERDLMMLSLAVDTASHPATMRFLEKPDVFNVSITRARVAQRIYTSITEGSLTHDSLLGAYFAGIKNGMPAPDLEAPASSRHDRFLKDVGHCLMRKGFQVWPAYTTGGLTIDLMVVRNRKCCGIDLIGYPGRFEGAFSLDSYRMFHRAGLRIIPIAYTRWLLDKEACLAAIETVYENG